VVQSARQTSDGRQLPVMVVAASFPRPHQHQPITLTHSRLETLFHEMGHVAHHCLCLNHYQHLSGARGELDFVELPSILFENFVWDWRVLRHFAVDDSGDGSVIPREMVERLTRSRRAFFAIETVAQAKQAMFDIQLFGRQPDSTSQQATGDRPQFIMDQIDAQYPLYSSVAGAASHASNVHLCHYGAGYYSYLMCRVYATAIWSQLLHPDPLSRRAGDALHKAILMHGGARQPQRILHELFGENLSAPIQQFVAQLTRQDDKHREDVQ